MFISTQYYTLSTEDNKEWLQHEPTYSTIDYGSVYGWYFGGKEPNPEALFKSYELISNLQKHIGGVIRVVNLTANPIWSNK